MSTTSTAAFDADVDSFSSIEAAGTLRSQVEAQPGTVLKYR